ncbi:thiol reductant ABC exporter subunit CydC [Achromobacter arsenitoxydans]|uniref:ABC transporter CydDC cysteine exporter family permease/ATP-binding protein CydC 2 n=1 Tax=Achromobacter arsenitoxydans SY8 TaxID=477184 RepID=H0FCW0_9BURK|nr:thiol reductant ABC exporter subunit CydC [Achromobacter arsenitoxydans]EHK63753.1 ABC transporter CydDC cysteine exporter family permease/ATP-binding protein CydC 2 [Achromobacter arsenitoxydans SY8]
MKNLLLLLPLYARRKSGLLLALFCALATVAAGVGLLGVSGWFLTGAALAGAGGMFNLFAPSALVRGLSFLRIVSRYADRVVGHSATLRLLADLRGVVFAALIRLTPRQLARYRSGDLVARMTGDVDALDTVFLFVLAPLATAILAGAVLTAVLGLWVPAAALVFALALLAACVAVPLWLLRAARKPGAAAQESAAELRAATLDAVDGHADMVAMHAQAETLAHFERLCEASALARRSQARVAVRGQWFLQIAAGIAVLALLWFGLATHEAGRIEGPVLAGLLLAVIGIFEVAGPIMRGASRMGSAISAAGRIREVTQCGPDMQDPAAPLALPDNGALELERVRFAYPARTSGESPLVLDDISLRVEPGERVAILGASGAGKSTLLHLLLRLEDPQGGRVLFGGRDARDCAQADWHRRIALLSQDAPLFLGTLRTNLLIGDPEAGDADLWRVLEAAKLGDFVRGLPDGLDTWAGETGSQLSAGQARRLCLARALLAPAAIIVLDEPTAGLDAAAEAAFFADLENAVRGRTVVLATHAVLPDAAVHRRVELRGGRLYDLSSQPAILA